MTPSSALLLLDLQNDFLHPSGAYGRAGQCSDDIAALPQRLKPLVDLSRRKNLLIGATLFTLVPGRGGEPMMCPVQLEHFYADRRRYLSSRGPPTPVIARIAATCHRENHRHLSLRGAQRRSNPPPQGHWMALSLRSSKWQSRLVIPVTVKTL